MRNLFKATACLVVLSGASLSYANQCPPLKINGSIEAQKLWQKFDSYIAQSYQDGYGFSQYCLKASEPIEATQQDDGFKFTFIKGSEVFLSLPTYEEDQTIDINISDETPSFLIVKDLGNDLLQIKTNYESDKIKLAVTMEEETIPMDISMKLDYDMIIHADHTMALKTDLSMPKFIITGDQVFEGEDVKLSLSDLTINGEAKQQGDLLQGTSDVQMGAVNLSIGTAAMMSWGNGKINSSFDQLPISANTALRSCFKTTEVTNLAGCYFDYLKQNLDTIYNSKAVINDVKYLLLSPHGQVDFFSKQLNLDMDATPNEKEQAVKVTYMFDDMDYKIGGIPAPDEFDFNNAALTLGLRFNKEKLNAAKTFEELDLNEHTVIVGLNLTHHTGAAIDFSSNTALSLDKKVTFDTIDTIDFSGLPLEHFTTDSTLVLTDQDKVFSIISTFEPNFKMYGALIKLLAQKEGDNKHKYHVTSKDGALKVNNKSLPKLF